MERPEFGTMRLEACLHGGPLDAGMAVHVRFEAGLQCSKQAVALLRGKLSRRGHLEWVLPAWRQWVRGVPPQGMRRRCAVPRPPSLGRRSGMGVDGWRLRSAPRASSIGGANGLGASTTDGCSALGTDGTAWGVSRPARSARRRSAAFHATVATSRMRRIPRNASTPHFANPGRARSWSFRLSSRL